MHCDVPIQRYRTQGHVLGHYLTYADNNYLQAGFGFLSQVSACENHGRQDRWLATQVALSIAILSNCLNELAKLLSLQRASLGIGGSHYLIGTSHLLSITCVSPPRLDA